MNNILTLDPSGTSKTGYFYFQNWNNWEIGIVAGKNYLEQAKKIEILLKKYNPEILIWETSYFWKTSKAQRDLRELVYLNGVLGYLAEQYGCQSQTILNHSVLEVAKSQDISGLTKTEQDWQFKDKSISIHERDALIVFWIYWVRILKKEWPFAE